MSRSHFTAAPTVVGVLAFAGVLAAPWTTVRADEPDAGAGSGAGEPMEMASPTALAAAGPPACSLRLPLCVHAPPSVGPAATLAALAATERAWDVVTGALALPPPDGDDDGRWHVYLQNDVEGHATARPIARDPLARFDRASSFGLVDAATPRGCDLDAAAAYAVARGALWRAAPATDPGSARAQSQAIARLATPCAMASDDIAAFQAEPERTLIDPEAPSFDRGASLFFEWLDATFATRPAALVEGLWALAPTRTPPVAARWAAAPTAFDVLRVSLAGALGTDSNLDDVFLQFALARAVEKPTPRLAWHVPWPDHPRRFASPQPVAPTGASYFLVDRAGAPAAARLRVEAVWEDFGRMRWAVLKLDAAGRPLAEIPITSTRLATSAAMTIEALDGVDRILVVGVNVGSTEHPFDPHQGWWEPHGWLLTVEAE